MPNFRANGHRPLLCITIIAHLAFFLGVSIVFQTVRTPFVHAAEANAAAANGVSAQKPSATIESLTLGAKKVQGLWTMYYKDQQLLVDIPNSQLGKNFIVLTSIARGIGTGVVLGGMSLGSGDGVIWSFRRIGDKVQVLRRNVRFRAKVGTPEADAVKLGYSDSILYSLPVLIDTPGGQLVDMTKIFMSDDQQIGRYLGSGFQYEEDRSTLAKVKSFPKNVEIQVASVYSGAQAIESVSDSRGVQVHVHYSISVLPEDGYKPRRADDRVGYFLTVLKDFSDKEDDQNFVRYINRWDLRKKDPSAKLSPPEDPIVFYLEKTVPVDLRPYVQEGIEEWNKAFEKLGFSKAIVVLQQKDDDDWDPEDIRYNTFRWITADSGFAMGPTRVNPMTGQILDADIIFDASFLEYWRQDYETFTNQDVTALMGGSSAIEPPSPFGRLSTTSEPPGPQCMLLRGMQRQMGFAAAALSAGGASPKGRLPEEFIFQALKQAVMHEVGHTLGLRHNFKASAWKSLKEIEAIRDGEHNPSVASVMDYLPADIAPEGKEQGPYFTQTIGPYDYWAIEYGYRPFSSSEKESAELEKIASRASEKALQYATDDDSRPKDPDPLSNTFDLGSDTLEFAKRQMTTVAALLPKVVERAVEDGQGYQRARQAFGMLLSEYVRAAGLAARIPGGVYVHRDHKGEQGERPPLEVVEASRQRDAMRLISQMVFSFPTCAPTVLNYLAATHWSHWGLKATPRLDYPIHEVVAKLQGAVLGRLLDPVVLSRLQDSELKVDPGSDAYTLSEHLHTLTEALFSELVVPPKAAGYDIRSPFIPSFRRNLQKMALKEFALIVSSGSAYPEDARTLLRMHLAQIEKSIHTILERKDLQLDDYSRAHLLDSQNLIKQVLDARLNLNSIS